MTSRDWNFDLRMAPLGTNPTITSTCLDLAVLLRYVVRDLIESANLVRERFVSNKPSRVLCNNT